MTAADAGRRYGGKTSGERRSERREKLLDAGLELFGTRGYAATTIEMLCSEARLNPRYFYEEFRTKTALLQAVYDRHVEAVFAAVLNTLEATAPSPRARLAAGMETFVNATLADERAARVNYFEMVGVTRELEARRRQVLRTYAEMIAAQISLLMDATQQAPGASLHLTAVALVSATDGLIIDRLTDPKRSNPTQADRDQIVATLTDLFSAAVD
ncbi:MAG: TetR/AcrR family transcriptional regulator [Solirubrobacterales bacterium]|nr:TetR/AcrR family transcriptional regulator [Solirubrobacterales bacterium]